MVNNDVWYSFECFACFREFGGTGLVFDVRVPETVPLELAKCPRCGAVCTKPASWPALEGGYGSRGDLEAQLAAERDRAEKAEAELGLVREALSLQLGDTPVKLPDDGSLVTLAKWIRADAYLAAGRAADHEAGRAAAAREATAAIERAEKAEEQRDRAMARLAEIHRRLAADEPPKEPSSAPEGDPKGTPIGSS